MSVISLQTQGVEIKDAGEVGGRQHCGKSDVYRARSSDYLVCGAAHLEDVTKGARCNWGEGAIVQVRGCEALSQDKSSVIRRVFKKIVNRQNHLHSELGWMWGGRNQGQPQIF